MSASENDRLPKPHAGKPKRLPNTGSGAGSSAPSPSGRLSCRRIILGVTGSIAAYKAAALLRLLRKEGAEVDVIPSSSAGRFVGESTFRGLGASVHTDMFDAPGELHVDLAARADLIVVAPTTADALARLATGRADDLLMATCLCRTCPLLVAPAMHPSMWAHPAVRANVTALVEHGARFIGPVEGEVASGAYGLGRMSEPEEIAKAVGAELNPRTGLRGRHVVVSAGPTSEAIDPVRSLTNVSSGKMGYAVAAEAAARGGRVTLVSGPVQLAAPEGVTRVSVRSALEMREALWQAMGPDLSGADALIMAAAVADYRPKAPATEKLKRTDKDRTIELTPNPDLLAEFGAARASRLPVLVGFALETARDEEMPGLARQKLVKKRIDLVVANHADDSLGRDDNRALLVGVRDCVSLGRLSKATLGEKILDWVERRLEEAEKPQEGTL